MVVDLDESNAVGREGEAAADCDWAPRCKGACGHNQIAGEIPGIRQSQRTLAGFGEGLVAGYGAAKGQNIGSFADAPSLRGAEPCGCLNLKGVVCGRKIDSPSAQNEGVGAVDENGFCRLQDDEPVDRAIRV